MQLSEKATLEDELRDLIEFTLRLEGELKEITEKNNQ